MNYRTSYINRYGTENIVSHQTLKEAVEFANFVRGLRHCSNVQSWVKMPDDEKIENESLTREFVQTIIFE